MPVGDSDIKSIFYAAVENGEYTPVTFCDFLESVIVPIASEKIIPMLQDEVLELYVKFWKRLPVEIRFPKKHRHQASIDRKKRKERRKTSS